MENVRRQAGDRPILWARRTATCRIPAIVAVLSYAYWQTQYGGRKDAIGSSVDIGATKYTIIGVAPEGFLGFANEPVAAFLPIAAAARSLGGDAKNPWYATYDMIWFEGFASAQAGRDALRPRPPI